MKKGVIFDMDGVLIDSEEYYFNRRMKYFKKNGMKPSHTNFKKFVGKSNDAIWELLVANPQIRPEIKSSYELSIKDDKINYKKLLMPGIHEFLKLLKNRNIKIALASAGNRNRNIKVLRDCQLYNYFDVVLGSEDVQANKPNPEMYIKAVEQLKLLPEECLVIEDSYHGILAAKAAKIETWALKPRKYTLNQKKADAIFPNVACISENFFKN